MRGMSHPIRTIHLIAVITDQLVGSFIRLVTASQNKFQGFVFNHRRLTIDFALLSSCMRNLRGCCDSCQIFAKKSMLRIPRPCAAVVAAATALGGQGFAMAIVLAPVACKSHASDSMGITGLFLDRSSPGFSVSRSCRPPACSPGFIISGSSFCLAILHKFICFRKSTPFSQGADPH